MPRPTLFRVLVQERQWDNWGVFACHLDRAARDLARKIDSPHLSGVFVARRTFDRWMAGELKDTPQRDHQAVLEHLLGFPCVELFSPPPAATGLARDESDGGRSCTDQGGDELTAHRPRRASQYDVAMLALDERHGG
ncbi:hypothetical protein GCM10023082_06480 [Streptomyces tremellae]|uniref:XRE family transcriptional regulator n=1 Tax=Streptomyces tremellae TaxID=1124239 RepID=A0ABP7DZP0_9ACTN